MTPGHLMTATTARPGNAHVLRELNAVTETGTDRDVAWARQAADALLELKKAADAARADGLDAVSAEALEEHSRWFRETVSAGMLLNAGRRTALEKRYALASRMAAREADYLRFACDLRVPFDNYPDAAVMSTSARGTARKMSTDAVAERIPGLGHPSTSASTWRHNGQKGVAEV